MSFSENVGAGPGMLLVIDRQQEQVGTKYREIAFIDVVLPTYE
jgi:hypothetical protein